VLLPAPAGNASASADTSRRKQIPALSGEGGS
jgi:hypothetical protein